MMRRAPKTTSRSLRVTRLKLTNWMNFKSLDVALAERAFFVGPNASGKSNLLDALRFLRSVASGVGGGLQRALKDRHGFSAVRCAQARNPSHVELGVDLGADDDAAIWTYVLRLQKGNKGFEGLVEHEAITGPDGVSKQRGKNRDDLQASQTLLEQASQNVEFRPVVEFFQSMQYLHVVPQVVRDPRRARDDVEDPHGGDLMKRIAETATRTRDARLKRIAEALTIAVPQFKDLRFVKDSEGRPHIEAAYSHWRSNATWHSEDRFSDGTLRLFGLLWSLGDRGGPLLLEEPELSLNDAVAEQVPRMIARMQRVSRRQVIATTHSTALLQDAGIGFDEVHTLVTTPDGTRVVTGSDDERVRGLVEEGVSLSEALMSGVKPVGVERLASIDTA